MAQRDFLGLLVIMVILIMGCGPDTIFLRPALDTPQQHVKNGHNLLARGKLDAANAEFVRAKSLDHRYAPAYVGLALVQGHRGDVRGGLETLNQAMGLAATSDEIAAVNQGIELLQGMQSTVQK